MAKRLKRISASQLKDQIDQYLHFVKKDGSVLLAKPIAETSDGWKVKNSKGHLLHLPSDQMMEIWKDEKAIQ